MKRYRYWLLLLIVPPILGGLVLYLPREDKPLLANAASWKHSGAIERAQPGREFVYSEEPEFADGQEDAIYWVASSNAGDGSGHLISKPIEAPRWITFTVSGDLTRPGNEVYLQLREDNRRIHVMVQTDPFYWRRVTMGLPEDWVGKSMEMVVDASPRDIVKDAVHWFGVSNPRALASGSVLLSHLRVLAILPVCVVSLLLFVLPGLPVAAWLALRGVIAHSQFLVVALLFGCVAGYVTFWAYFCQPIFGISVSVIALIGGAALCAASLRRGRPTRSLILSVDVTTPLILTALVALFYSSIGQSVNLRTPIRVTPRVRFLEFVMALDNEIPYLFGERVYSGGVGLFANPVKDGADSRFLLPGWHTSDRPPLQTGILLMQFPVGYLLGQPAAWSLVFSCVLQCFWVPAVWELWRAAQLSRRAAGIALLMLVLTGFLLFNSVFTWPKLLAATLAVNAISFALFQPARGTAQQSLVRASLCGLAAALAFLAHSGVAVTLLPLGLLLLIPRYFLGLGSVAVAAGAFLLTIAPWSLYQRFYDPPGTELIRQHLAGRSETWLPERSTFLNLIDAYRSLSPRQILDNKIANLEVLFRASERPADDHYPWPPYGHPKPWPVDATSLRRCEFTCLFWAPGFLNLGWLVMLIFAWRRPPVLDRTLGIALPALVLASALTWVLLMFGPGTTVTHQGSYATSLLLLAALAAWLTTLPGWLPYLLLVAQGLLFATGWLLTSPANNYGLQNPFMIVSAASFFFLLSRVALANPSISAKAV